MGGGRVMSVIKGCVIAAVALAAGAMAETARADEAFICDGGRVAYVKPGELEQKKLQDPCIAKYFEKIQTVKPSAAKVESATAAVQHSSATVAPPSDHYNVRIINAAPGQDVWFRRRP